MPNEQSRILQRLIRRLGQRRHETRTRYYVPAVLCTSILVLLLLYRRSAHATKLNIPFKEITSHRVEPDAQHMLPLWFQAMCFRGNVLGGLGAVFGCRPPKGVALRTKCQLVRGTQQKKNPRGKIRISPPFPPISRDGAVTPAR